MKKLLAILALVLCTGLYSGAQSPYKAPEVKISKDMVRKGNYVFYVHVVRYHETLYSIGKAYGVSSLDIIDVNPDLHLDRRPIRPGDVLYIPFRTPAQTIPAATPPVEDTPEDAPAEETLQEEIEAVDIVNQEEEVQADSTVTLPAVKEYEYIPADTVNVSMFLPLGVKTTLNVKYMNFYFGALMAVRDICGKDPDANVSLSIYDTVDQTGFFDLEEKFFTSDIILGPVSHTDISTVLPYLPEGKFIISPMDPKTESLTGESPVILAATPMSRQIEDALEWMFSERAEADTLIAVTETDHKLSLNMENMLGAITEKVDTSILKLVDYSLSGGLEMNEYFTLNTHMGDTLTTVAAISERDIFVKDVIRNIALQNNLNHNVVIYGPSKTRSSDVEEMCDARLHTSTTYHLDYDDARVIRFIMDYRALFGADPDSFAFHGYDTVMYFVSACREYGKMWDMKLSDYQYSGLQTYFKFTDTEESVGKVNSGLRRVVYAPDYDISWSNR